MPVERGARVLYWDTSAVLSALVREGHTDPIRRLARQGGSFLLSSLAFAETSAVLSRLGREGRISLPELDEALKGLQQGPWRWLAAGPTADVCEHLARRHALHGADLWHLATVVTVRVDLPELRLLTLDTALARAAKDEGVSFSLAGRG